MIRRYVTGGCIHKGKHRAVTNGERAEISRLHTQEFSDGNALSFWHTRIAALDDMHFRKQFV